MTSKAQASSFPCDVNDAERLRHDPAMRWIVGGKAAQSSAASPSDGDGLEIQTRMTAIPTSSSPGPDSHGLATCVSLNAAVAARVGRHRVSLPAEYQWRP
jgi:hypothetical protein